MNFSCGHALVLDTFTDEPHSEIFEEAVSVAASFACTVLTQESLLDLLFVGAGVVLLHRRARTGARGPDAGNSGVGPRVRRQAIRNAGTAGAQPCSRRERLHLRVATMGRRAEKPHRRNCAHCACQCWCWLLCNREDRSWTPAHCAPSRKNFTFLRSERLRNSSQNCHDGNRSNA